MANHFSVLKRARQTTTRTARNRANTSQLPRTALRKFREALQSGKSADAQSHVLRHRFHDRQGRQKGPDPQECRIAV